MTIIERARKLLETRPGAEQGNNGNATTFGVAEVLVWGFGLSPAEALPLFLEYNQKCTPPWSDRELARMLNSVLTRQHDKARGYLVEERVSGDANDAAVAAEKPRKRVTKEMRLESLKAAQDPRLQMEMPQWRSWLMHRSEAQPATVTPEQYLDALYRPGEKVLIFNKMWGTQGDYGRVIGKGTWKLGQYPGGAAVKVQSLPEGSQEGMQFLMQPVDGEWRLKSGSNKMSRRTKDSVRRWPYLLLESDNAPLEMWLNCIVRARLRIVSITASAGRSLHALVRIDKESEQDLIEELDHKGARETLTILGCDFQSLHGMVYPRLPNTYRDGKRVSKFDSDGKPVMNSNGFRAMEFKPFAYGRAKQALLYFNPRAEIGECIAEGRLFEHAR